MANKIIYIFLLILGVSATAQASSVHADEDAGTLTFINKNHETRYDGVIGERDGLSRGLTEINGKPALYSLSRGSYYFTLIASGNALLIDCAYTNDRNSRNGARVTAGVCQLNAPLDEVFDDIAQTYSDQWQSSIYSFDTFNLIKKNQRTDFLIGRIGAINIYDRYTSIEALENSHPLTYIKSPKGCFHFKNKEVYLMFLKGSNTAAFLDIMTSIEPLAFERFNEPSLIKLAVDQCN
jgi:hypothetical protein